MKTLKAMGCALVLFGFSAADAGPMFYNAMPGKYTIAVTLPNGKVDKQNISDGSSGLSSSSFVLAAGVKSVKVEISDDAGETVWKGTGKDDDTFVVVPGGKGVQVVYAGVYGSPDSPQAGLFMNVSGESLKLDLEGHNGLGAVRGIVPGTSFDPKKPVRLDPKEVTYDVLAQVKGGEKEKISGTVGPGRYCLIWKDYKGALHATALGKIPKKK